RSSTRRTASTSTAWSRGWRCSPRRSSSSRPTPTSRATAERPPNLRRPREPRADAPAGDSRSAAADQDLQGLDLRDDGRGRRARPAGAAAGGAVGASLAARGRRHRPPRRRGGGAGRRAARGGGGGGGGGAGARAGRGGGGGAGPRPPPPPPAAGGAGGGGGGG